ncbi:MAG: hypothetical protein WC449_03170 [Candidatus Paceibacterota bacterium]
MANQNIEPGKKKIILIIIAILLFVFLLGYYFYLSNTGKPAATLENKPSEIASSTGETPKASEAAPTSASATPTSVMPSVQEQQPLQNKPDINPVDKINPIKGIKVNPF